MLGTTIDRARTQRAALCCLAFFFCFLCFLCGLLGDSRTALAQDEPYAAPQVLPGGFDLYWDARWAMSPDGAHVYVAGGQAIGVYARDGATGAFVQIEAQRLRGVTNVVARPDGKGIYVLVHHDSCCGASLYHFARDPVTGQLTDRTAMDVNDDHRSALAIHPDGRTLYTLNEGAWLTWYTIDPLTGALAFAGQFAVESDSSPDALAFSPDGAYLYMAGASRSSLLLFALDPATGAPTLRATYQGGAGGIPEAALDGLRQFIAAPNHPHGYVVSPYGASVPSSGSITLFARNPLTGELAYRSQMVLPRSSDGEHWHAAFHPDGKSLYLIKSSGGLEVFRVDPATGALTAAAHFLAPERPELASAQDLLVTPGGKHLYVLSMPERYNFSGVPGHHVLDFAVGGAPGAVTFLRAQPLSAGGWGDFLPHQAIVSRDGRQLYVVDGGDWYNTEDGKVLTFRLDEQTGLVGELVRAARWSHPYFDYENWAEVESADGKFLYVQGTGLGVFARDPATGALDWKFTYRQGEQWDPILPGFLWGGDMVVSADNNYLYMGGGDAVSIFARDVVTGGLEFLATTTIDGLTWGEGPKRLLFSSDGKFLYTNSPGDNAVSVLARSADDWTLTVVETEKNGAGGVTDMGTPHDLAISPDGKHLYVAARKDDNTAAIVVFDRDAASGVLTFLASYGAAPDGSDPSFRIALDISADGRYVFFTTDRPGAVIIFARDPATGLLSRVQTLTATELPIMYSPMQIAAHPSDGNVYVLSTLGGGIVVLAPVKPNHAPVCTGAAPSLALLWPADHSFAAIQMQGVNDADGDALTIAVSTIFQDEPVDAPGSGGTGPDGKGIGTPTALVRAERMAAGDGRVYHITFTATDRYGATCTGTIRVGVPYSRISWEPVDGGAEYASTAYPANVIDIVEGFLSAGSDSFEVLLPLLRTKP